MTTRPRTTHPSESPRWTTVHHIYELAGITTPIITLALAFIR